MLKIYQFFKQMHHNYESALQPNAPAIADNTAIATLTIFCHIMIIHQFYLKRPYKNPRQKSLQLR